MRTADGGRVLRIEQFQLQMVIPPGALVTEEEISFEAITDVPPDIELGPDEGVVSVGMKFYPSGSAVQLGD